MELSKDTDMNFWSALSHSWLTFFNRTFRKAKQAVKITAIRHPQPVNGTSLKISPHTPRTMISTDKKLDAVSELLPLKITMASTKVVSGWVVSIALDVLELTIV